MRYVVLLVLALCLVALVAGCNDGPKQHNFSYIFNRVEWDFGTAFRADPSADVSTFATYVLEASAEEKDALAAKQLAWLATNELEEFGYRRVESADAADMVVRLSVTNEYRERYIPPQQYTEDVYVPSEKVKVKVDTSTWGAGYGSSTTEGTVTIPGHTEQQTVTKPGYYDSAYYPSVTLQALDNSRVRSGANPADAVVWEGRVTGRTSLPNVVLTGQYLLDRTIGKLPPRRGRVSPDPTLPPGRSGIEWRLATADGMTFYPAVIGVEKKSPAARAGVRQYDLVVAIDGVSTANTPDSELVGRLRGTPGTVRQLTVRRLSEEVTIPVTLGLDSTWLPKQK